MQGEVMILITGEQALQRLTLDCHFPEAKARRLLNIAWEFGQKAEPCPGGYVHIWYHGIDDTDQHVFSVIEHIGRKAGKALAQSARKQYTERNSSKLTLGETMPPRRRPAQTKQPEPEVEETGNGSTSKLDRLDKYLTGNITPTLTDYVEWFGANVTDPDKLDSERLIALAVTFYGEFQASDFNKDRKAERKAARETRAASNGDNDADEPAEAAAPARGRGRGARSQPAAAKPAATGRRPGRKPAAAAKTGAAVY
jgi:hypothetical protein